MATLYLDFNENHLSSWRAGNKTFTDVTTPVWDMDGHPTRFNAAEQAIIREVWSRVAEDFAPFNINVSTDYYGDFANGKAFQACIGGDNTDWLHDDASGIRSIGSFHDGEGRPMNGAGALVVTVVARSGGQGGAGKAGGVPPSQPGPPCRSSPCGPCARS